MLFSSLLFLYGFLPIVLLVVWLAPKSWRNALLLWASLFFYAWGGVSYTAILVLSIVINYGFGRLLGRYRGKPGAKKVLLIGVAMNLGMLFLFKYTVFFISQLNVGLVAMGMGDISLPDIVLPLGISFFTFQAISYLVDVYRQQCVVQKRLDHLGLYIALFPQLIAGPIVRYHDLEQQLVKRQMNGENTAVGIERFIIGLAKKVLLANNFALLADEVFAVNPASLDWQVAWIGLVAYSLQIYFDFSGYSDMAIGLGRMFGFVIPENFNFPYIARSVREFWRRWHISLSQWFRDYLYIPLGGNRKSIQRTYLNLLIVFLLTGLWHGANWTFILWGLMHGGFIVIEKWGLEKWLARCPRPLAHVYTLLVVVLAWVLFRADHLSYALAYYKALFGVGWKTEFRLDISSYLNREFLLALAIGLLTATPLAKQAVERLNSVLRTKQLANIGGIGGALALMLIFLWCSMHLATNSYNPFIYFRF
ncbi:MAG: MBOAT family protein [Saprospiraceae bacterium]